MNTTASIFMYMARWAYKDAECVSMFKITGNAIIFSAACSGYQQSKFHISALLAICEGNPTVTDIFHSKKG